MNRKFSYEKQRPAAKEDPFNFSHSEFKKTLPFQH